MEPTIDISKMSVQELKAMAYDQIATKEVAEENLRRINAEITKKLTPQLEEVKSEEVKTN